MAPSSLPRYLPVHLSATCSQAGTIRNLQPPAGRMSLLTTDGVSLFFARHDGYVSQLEVERGVVRRPFRLIRTISASSPDPINYLTCRRVRGVGRVLLGAGGEPYVPGSGFLWMFFLDQGPLGDEDHCKIPVGESAWSIDVHEASGLVVVGTNSHRVSLLRISRANEPFLPNGKEQWADKLRVLQVRYPPSRIAWNNLKTVRVHMFPQEVCSHRNNIPGLSISRNCEFLASVSIDEGVMVSTLWEGTLHLYSLTGNTLWAVQWVSEDAVTIIEPDDPLITFFEQNTRLPDSTRTFAVCSCNIYVTRRLHHAILNAYKELQDTEQWVSSLKDPPPSSEEDDDKVLLPLYTDAEDSDDSEIFSDSIPDDHQKANVTPMPSIQSTEPHFSSIRLSSPKPELKNSGWKNRMGKKLMLGRAAPESVAASPAPAAEEAEKLLLVASNCWLRLYRRSTGLEKVCEIIPGPIPRNTGLYAHRYNQLVWLPELSLVVCAFQLTGLVSLVRVVRLGPNGPYRMILENTIPDMMKIPHFGTSVDMYVEGITVMRRTFDNGPGMPPGVVFELYIVRNDGTCFAYEIQRRTEQSPVDITSRIV